MHHLKVSNINTVVEKHQKFYMLMLFSMNDEVPSITSQIVEQIEVIPEVVLSEVSKLIDKVMSKKKGLYKIENGITIDKHPAIFWWILL